MVYESRRGEVFVLGATTWRIEEITRDRVVVVARARRARQDAVLERRQAGPAARARSRARARSCASWRPAPRADALARLRDDVGLDELAAANLVTYLDEQREATGAVPDDRTIVVERFPDEIGDWRVCILTPFGAQVHAPWALAIEARLAERVGPGVQVLWSDDGIMLRLPEADDGSRSTTCCFDPDEIDELVVRGCRARRCSPRVPRGPARALLLPRRRPGQRTPLWQQRQRSADLLVAAARHPTFPILLETTASACATCSTCPRSARC